MHQGFGSLWTSIRDAVRTVTIAPIQAARSIEQAIGITTNPIIDRAIAITAPAPAPAPAMVEAPAPPAPAPPSAPTVRATPAPAPAPVYYRTNPDGSVTAVPLPPDVQNLTEFDVASPLTATYVPPSGAEPAPAKASALPVVLLGLVALFALGS